ncbi:MAG: hypothetical protein K2Q22_03830, partial [Cytophagales bacterium]|nr:hypothetical protein [Cytophagales bacterium]
MTNFGLTGASSNWVSSTSTSTTGSFTFDPPVITGISPSLTICSGFATTVSVTATGSLLTYQWYANGSPIPGQTLATLTISGSLTTASGTLFAVVSRGA